jgi:type IV pilus assembly protein PilV
MISYGQMIKEKQAGSTLIEVLITVLVLSVGLLGMATLQFDAVKLNHESLLRSKAVNLAYDMSDRVRVNRDGANAGNYSIAIATAPPAVVATPSTPSQIANADMNAWLTSVALELPAGDGSIVYRSDGSLNRFGDELTIQVCWDESRGGGAPLTCFSFVTGL